MTKVLPECFQNLQNFEPDRLLPRESAAYVVKNATGQISVQQNSVNSLAEELLSKFRNNEVTKIADFSAHEMHPNGSGKSTVDWIFLIDTINFSFWTENESKFCVTYKESTYTGYFAACACVNRAIESGINITQPDCMINIAVEDVEKIFRGDDGKSMPLCEERAKIIAEAGRVLLEKFNGSFYTCLEKCQRSAMKLLAIIVENFESYRDYAMFKGQKISFLKRAQILVADLYGCLHGKNHLVDFDDIGEITMFADYRVPQYLAYRSVIIYSDDLKKLLRSRVLMESGSETEVEIRAFSIQAIEDIVKKIEELREPSDKGLPKVTPAIVDNLLWYGRRVEAKDVENQVDYHRIRTIYY